MQNENPFTPGFGDVPPYLAGREDLLDRHARLLAGRPITYNRCSLILGPTGVGKTAAAHGIASAARSGGWVSVYVTVRPGGRDGDGILDQIRHRCEILARGQSSPRELAGVSGPFGLGVTLGPREPARYAPSLRTVFGDTASAVAGRKEGKGLLVIVDEVHNITREECGSIGAAVQEAVTVDGTGLGFVGIGLPQMEQTHLNDPGFTFLQRCRREPVGVLGPEASVEALRRPLDASSVVIDPGDLQAMAAATMGYGYAIQSAGYHLWELCGGSRRTASSRHVAEALRLMDDDIARHIVTPVWSSLTGKELDFLTAMHAHGGPVEPAYMTRAMGGDGTSRVYKRRLLKKGVIHEVDSVGRLDFSSTAVRARAGLEAEAAAAAAAERERRRSEEERLRRPAG